jgi:hypothetical protein
VTPAISLTYLNFRWGDAYSISKENDSYTAAPSSGHTMPDI